MLQRSVDREDAVFPESLSADNWVLAHKLKTTPFATHSADNIVVVITHYSRL